MAKRVIIRNVRLSFVNVINQRDTMDGSGTEWSTQIIIDKDDEQVEQLTEHCQDQLKEKFGDKAKFGKMYNFPIRDGDEEREEEPHMVNKVFFTARAKKRAPQVVDKHLQPITDEDDVHSGCYANVSVNVFPYEFKDDKTGNVISKGVSFGLNNIQVLETGDRLDNFVAAVNEFTEVD